MIFYADAVDLPVPVASVSMLPLCLSFLSARLSARLSASSVIFFVRSWCVRSVSLWCACVDGNGFVLAFSSTHVSFAVACVGGTSSVFGLYS